MRSFFASAGAMAHAAGAQIFAGLGLPLLGIFSVAVLSLSLIMNWFVGGATGTTGQGLYNFSGAGAWSIADMALQAESHLSGAGLNQFSTNGINHPVLNMDLLSGGPLPSLDVNLLGSKLTNDPGNHIYGAVVIQCASFVHAVFDVAHQSLPQPVPTAALYWTDFKTYFGGDPWLQIPVGQMPFPGDMVVWSNDDDPNGHIAIVVHVTAPKRNAPGYVVVAQANAPATQTGNGYNAFATPNSKWVPEIGEENIHLMEMDLSPSYQVSTWPRYHVQGYIRNKHIQQTANTFGTNISKRVVRLPQWDDASQYNSDNDFQTWRGSACSAASIGEVLNAYQFFFQNRFDQLKSQADHQRSAAAIKALATLPYYPRLRIADILPIESGVGAITPDLGLINGVPSIQATINAFNRKYKTDFVATAVSNPNIDKVISIANAGLPVIVAFPPATYDGGHILVLVGGDSQHVQVVDSSHHNMQVLSRSTFEGWWEPMRFSVTITLPELSASGNRTGYDIVGPPSISAAQINDILGNVGAGLPSGTRSPAAGKGQALYDYGVLYGIDPVFALAFFQHESYFGTTGEATVTRSLGNSRCLIPYAIRCVGGYSQFATWEDGFHGWYEMMRKLYVDEWGATTVEKIIPHYAPSSDGNNEAAYIASVEKSVDAWRKGSTDPAA